MSGDELSDDLMELYQQVIVDHSKRPRNFRKLEGATVTAEGFNPLCGDKVQLYLRVDGERIQDVSFEGSGCAISTASASMMTESLKGRTVEEALRLFEEFHLLITERDPDDFEEAELGKLRIFAGVRQFPSRVKCAGLVWHTMKGALKGERAVSTE